MAVVGAFLLGAELVQRFIVAPLVAVLPGTRDRILTGWMRAMAAGPLGLLCLLGGVRIDRRARVPGREGILLVSNHQSLLDIPIAVLTLENLHPRIVTRARYARGIPVVSHLLRLTRAPLIDPGRPTGPQLEALRVLAAECTHPMVIFPEGHRSRDGRLQPFKRGGLRVILSGRPWQVYLLVVDGLFSAGRFVELVRALRGLRGVAVAVGPFEWTDPKADPGPFLEELERRMGAELAALRGGRA